MLRAGRYSKTARQLDHLAVEGSAPLIRYAEWWQALAFMTAA